MSLSTVAVAVAFEIKICKLKNGRALEPYGLLRGWWFESTQIYKGRWYANENGRMSRIRTSEIQRWEWHERINLSSYLGKIYLLNTELRALAVDQRL